MTQCFMVCEIIWSSLFRLHCVCRLCCGKQPGAHLRRGAAVRAEERAGLHPDLLCDRLALRVLREGAGHWHKGAVCRDGGAEGTTLLVSGHLSGHLHKCSD